MICLLALVVFGILGLFSATHRKIAREAFDCVFKRITFRPCTAGLDKRLKAKIVSKSLGKSPTLGKLVNKHFELLSWALTLLTIASLAYSVLGVYNFAVYGNCNGETSQAECIYSGVIPAADVGCESPFCQNEECTCKDEFNCQELEASQCGGSCYGSNLLVP